MQMSASSVHGCRRPFFLPPSGVQAGRAMGWVMKGADLWRYPNSLSYSSVSAPPAVSLRVIWCHLPTSSFCQVLQVMSSLLTFMRCTRAGPNTHEATHAGCKPCDLLPNSGSIPSACFCSWRKM